MKIKNNKKMVKIHWSIYLILGAVVLYFSNRLNSQTSSRDFTLFIWIGYLFLIIGIAKLGIWFIHRKKESPIENRDIRRNIYRRMPQRQRVARFCPNCGISLQGYENFCSVCGQRVR